MVAERGKDGVLPSNLHERSDRGRTTADGQEAVSLRASWQTLLELNSPLVEFLLCALLIGFVWDWLSHYESLKIFVASSTCFTRSQW